MDLQKRTDVRTGGGLSVWRGEQAGGGLFLVKEVRPDAANRGPLAQRLADEFAFLAALDHLNVLKAVRLDGGRAVFGDARCSLAQYLRHSGPLPPAQVANVLTQAADALDHLHARRRGHGSIGLHSLLVGPSGEVLLGDFLGCEWGRGAIPDPDPEPKYLAPELIDAAAGRRGPAADLYGLGYAALELLAGDRFDGLFELPAGAKWLSWHADLGKDLTGWREAVAHAPVGLLDVIDGLIAKRPGRRAYQTAAQLRDALRRSGLTSAQRLAAFDPTAPPAGGTVAPTRRGEKGRRVGPFALRTVIHRGAHGRVYLARWDGRDGREAAVRVLPADLSADATAVGRFARRVVEAAGVRDRHLVRMFPSGVVDVGGRRRWYVATEYLRGGSLRDRLSAGAPLSVGRAVAMARGVARGLAALHDAGLVHGRVRPDCVLFDRVGRAKLGEFWHPPGPVGTGDVYQPPERRAGAQPTPTGDIYALGATLAEALTGVRPEARVRPPGRANPAVSPALDEFIRAATDPDPRVRPKTAADAVRQLDALV